MNEPVTTLAEDLFLLAFEPTTGKPRCQTKYLRFGLAGAVLAELAAAGRIAEDRGRIQVVSVAPTGDPHLDESLSRLPGAPKRMRTVRWIRRSSGRHLPGCAERLAKRGAIRIERRRVLGLFTAYRYPATSPEWSAAALQRLGSGAAAPERDPRGGTLAGLAGAVGLPRRLFPGGGDAKRLRKSMRRLAREQWPASAVRRVVRAEKSAGDGGGG